MIKVKQGLIVSQGVPVTVTASDGTVTETKALVGQGSRTANSSITTLESNRKGQFLPTVTVGGGSIVDNNVNGESYIVIATMREVILGKVAAIVTQMTICNAVITVRGIVATADANGNRSKTPTVKLENQRVHVQALTADLKQYDPGLHAEAEYQIYCPTADISLLDSVLLNMNGKNVPLKVVDTNYISFSGVVVLQVCSETRK